LALSTLKNSQASADLPVRILSVVLGGSCSLAANSFGINAAMGATWTVTDLALLEAAGAGDGLPDHEAIMADCMAGYVDFVRANRVASSKVVITGAELRPAIREWPAGSGNWFASVECTLTLFEV
jgi:hypothetical protein